MSHRIVIHGLSPNPRTNSRQLRSHLTHRLSSSRTRRPISAFVKSAPSSVAPQSAAYIANAAPGTPPGVGTPQPTAESALCPPAFVAATAT